MKQRFAMRWVLVVIGTLGLTSAGCIELGDDADSLSGELEDLELSADGTMFLQPGEPDPTIPGAPLPELPASTELAPRACDGGPASALVFGDHAAAKAGLTAGLTSRGHSVTQANALPANLSGFDIIFHVGSEAPLSTSDRTRLAAFVARGGGLHLSGERPCCELMNSSLGALVNEVVVGGGITIGGQGDVRAANGSLFFPYLVNNGAKGGIAAQPNAVQALRLLSPGGIAGITNPANVVAVGQNNVPVAAIWDKEDLVNKAGRLFIAMDVNWLHALDANNNLQFLENLVSYMCGATPRDEDNDGVVAEVDCNDLDSTVGALLYENDFSANDGFFGFTPQLGDDWIFEDSKAVSVDGGQEALIGQPRDWSDVVVFATVSARGTESECGNDAGETPCSSTDRWRAGLLLRTALDADQGEGFHGYRCALSSNAVNGCYEDGLFLQIGEFMDAPEDGIPSECNASCPPNETFDGLGRQNHTSIDLSDPTVHETATLAFYAIGKDMYCEATSSTGETVTVRGSDDSFASGTVGLSTLNMFGEFDQLRVCEALALPGAASR